MLVLLAICVASQRIRHILLVTETFLDGHVLSLSACIEYKLKQEIRSVKRLSAQCMPNPDYPNKSLPYIFDAYVL